MLIRPTKQKKPVCFFPYLKTASERKLAEDLKLSRTTLRAVLHGEGNPTLKTLERLAELKDLRLCLLFSEPNEMKTDSSVLGVSGLVLRDGFESWKIHLMNFVDEFRRSKDIRLVLFPPLTDLDPKLKSILASVTLQLCGESKIDTPEWALKSQFLLKPWFPAGVENLKASALIESPLAFRRNNIFVLKNFMERV